MDVHEAGVLEPLLELGPFEAGLLRGFIQVAAFREGLAVISELNPAAGFDDLFFV